MTKKDLFSIIIKLFGLYSIISFITTHLAMMVSFATITEWEPIIILWILIAVSVFCGFAVLLVFYPNVIIKWFKLDKGYDNTEAGIPKMDLSNLIKVAVIIVGFLFIIQSFSPLLVNITYLLPPLVGKGDVAEMISRGDSYTFIHLMNLVIGYLLLTNYSAITGFLLRKDSDSIKQKEEK